MLWLIFLVLTYFYDRRTKSNQRWMKLRTTVQLSSAIQKKPPLKREDSFLKRFSTRQTPLTQETVSVIIIFYLYNIYL